MSNLIEDAALDRLRVNGPTARQSPVNLGDLVPVVRTVKPSEMPMNVTPMMLAN